MSGMVAKSGRTLPQIAESINSLFLMRLRTAELVNVKEGEADTIADGLEKIERNLKALLSRRR